MSARMASIRSFPLAGRAALRTYASVRGSTNSQPFALSTSSTTSQLIPTHRSLPQHQHGISPCYTSNNYIQKSSISTTAPRSVVGWIQDKLADRAKNKKAEKLIHHIELMANSPKWTIQMFADEIDETLNDWTTKIPGAGKTTEVQAAKESQQVIKSMVEHLGGDVTAEDLPKMNRKEKLKLVIACKKPVEDVNRVLESFKQMDVMHRILRYRKEKGIPLPTDQDGLKLAMQQDGMKVMTKAEKAEMRETFEKMSGY